MNKRKKDKKPIGKLIRQITDKIVSKKWRNKTENSTLNCTRHEFLKKTSVPSQVSDINAAARVASGTLKVLAFLSDITV